MAFILKPYDVTVAGFPAMLFPAASAGKARAAAWHQYCSYRQVTFGEFLALSVVRRSAKPPYRFGEPITVAGLPAYRVPGFVGSYVRFVRDDSDIILCSHPADVQPAEAK